MTVAVIVAGLAVVGVVAALLNEHQRPTPPRPAPPTTPPSMRRERERWAAEMEDRVFGPADQQPKGER